MYGVEFFCSSSTLAIKGLADTSTPGMAETMANSLTIRAPKFGGGQVLDEAQRGILLLVLAEMEKFMSA